MFVSCGNRSNVPIWSLALFSPMPLQSPVIWSPKSSKPVIIIQFELFCAFKRKSPECKEETFCVCFVEMLCNKTWEILSLDRRKYFPWIGGNPWAVGGWGWGTKSSHGPTPLHCHHIYKTLNRIRHHFVNSKQRESDSTEGVQNSGNLGIRYVV